MKPAESLAKVDRTLDELEKIVRKAGEAGCDALALPEDTLGLLKWEAGNPDHLNEVLPVAVERMLDRLGRAAAPYKMYLIVCSDTIEPRGAIRNTAFLLGRDGKQIGRYHKVNLPLAEQSRTPGDGFPVFDKPDLGTIGMLICYDLVFPETTRCLALQGADVVFVPTMGGAAMGDEETSLAAFRTRAVDNFMWLVVAKRGSGSMIISPKGKIVAATDGGRWAGHRRHRPVRRPRWRRRLQYAARFAGTAFRERVPASYRILTDPTRPCWPRCRRTSLKKRLSAP